MILYSNLPKLRQIAQASSRVLDVGGWYQPFNPATHVLDLRSYETRRTHEALVPGDPERFSAETWLVHDACEAPWPYPDKFFDFVICSHLLEDVRDPLIVCKELVRVAKSGYVETPSRVREIYSKHRFFGLRSLLGKIPEVGFYHHRWFVEADGTHLRFTAKTTALLEDRQRFLTRQQLGRKLTEQEAGLGLFWEGHFTCEEAIVSFREDYDRFGRQALQALAGSK